MLLKGWSPFEKVNLRWCMFLSELWPAPAKSPLHLKVRRTLEHSWSCTSTSLNMQGTRTTMDHNKGNQLLKRTKNTFQKSNLGTVEHHAAPIFEDLHDMSWIHNLFLVFDRIDLVSCLCPSGVTKLTSAESAQKILGLQSRIEENSLRNSKSRYVCMYVGR